MIAGCGIDLDLRSHIESPLFYNLPVVVTTASAFVPSRFDLATWFVASIVKYNFCSLALYRTRVMSRSGFARLGVKSKAEAEKSGAPDI